MAIEIWLGTVVSTRTMEALNKGLVNIDRKGSLKTATADGPVIIRHVGPELRESDRFNSYLAHIVMALSKNGPVVQIIYESEGREYLVENGDPYHAQLLPEVDHSHQPDQQI